MDEEIDTACRERMEIIEKAHAAGQSRSDSFCPAKLGTFQILSRQIHHISTAGLSFRIVQVHGDDLVQVPHIPAGISCSSRRDTKKEVTQSESAKKSVS